MNSYTLKHLPREFRLNPDAEELHQLPPEEDEAIVKLLCAEVSRQYRECFIAGFERIANHAPQPEVLRLDRFDPTGMLSGKTMTLWRGVAHATTAGYMDGLAGANRACPFHKGGIFADAWHHGQQQGREHRARTHEGNTSILTQASIEAALIRLGQL